MKPAAAGPTSRAPLKLVELSATALGRCLSSTSCPTKAWRTGASNAAAQPKVKANRYTSHSVTTPATVRRPSSIASTAITAWVISSSLRWS